jgi:2-polyprenyl-3-methyl-5-hydroxy-6-metoxy-1,4-benzoquinol methylase
VGSAAEHPWFETRQACPACGAHTFREIYTAPYDADPIRGYLVDAYAAVGGSVEFEYLEGASYTLCECSRCGLIFQRDIPNDALMDRLYEHWIDPQGAFDRHLAEDDLSYYAEYAQEVMQLLAYFGRVPAKVSIMDFGMGWGRWAMMAKAFGCDAHGSELSADRIAYARANGVKIVAWDDIPDQRFDVINANQVFEHIANPLDTLNYLKRGLAPDGLIKIAVPRPRDIERTLEVMDWKAAKYSKNSLNDVAPLEHINCFRLPALREMARLAGMEQVFLPVGVQYRTLTDWAGLKRSVVQLLRPVYRSWLKKGNVIFLRASRSGEA